MTNICEACGKELPTEKHQYCGDCIKKRAAEQKKKSCTALRAIMSNNRARRYIRVTYPDVAHKDLWTRLEYETYKDSLPAGCTVEGL